MMAPFEPFDENKNGKKFSLDVMLIEEQVQLTVFLESVLGRGHDRVGLVPGSARFSQLLLMMAPFVHMRTLS